ncbi:MAG: hypothetical protein LBD23_18250 [Oscillospiraceae bacterium]|jgi:hypothetical protein|nr:hypothetical protein [Oscillospiraceae bacterium]
MKKVIALSTLIFILLALVSGCSQNYRNSAFANQSRAKARIYTISGENESIAIKNGIIHITGELEQFIGGELVFIGEEPTNVHNYRFVFYFYLDGTKTDITSTIVTSEGNDNGITISPYLGSTVAETLFDFEVWEIIPDSLHFSLSGALINGETFEYAIPLAVNEVLYDLSDYRPMIYVQDTLYGETADVVSILPNQAYILGAVEKVVPQTVPMVKENFVSNVMPAGSDIYSTDEYSNVIYVRLYNGNYSIYIEIE